MMHHATIYIDIANSTFEQYYARSPGQQNSVTGT